MNKVIQFDSSRVKPASNVSTTGTILTLPTMAAHDEDRDEVISLTCTALGQNETANSADVLESAMYAVMRARYAHVANDDRANKLIASGVSSLMSDETIYSDVMDRLMTADLLSV